MKKNDRSFARTANLRAGDPAYKKHWLTILLDGTAEDALVKELLEISFDLTNKKRTNSKRGIKTE